MGNFKLGIRTEKNVAEGFGETIVAYGTKKKLIELAEKWFSVEGTVRVAVYRAKDNKLVYELVKEN